VNRWILWLKRHTEASSPAPPPLAHEGIAFARSELQDPGADGFVGYVEPTLGEELVHVSKAEREAQVEPYSVLDDNRRKAATAV
jgi:hypothetical protein